MDRKSIGIAVMASFLGALLGVVFYSWIVANNPLQKGEEPIARKQQKALLTRYSVDSTIKVPPGLNFVPAAEVATTAVVHISSLYGDGSRSQILFDDWWNNVPKGYRARATGSGVILTDDGYIVTNNHVIEDATRVQVTLHDNREYEARIVGTDPSTDLALLKIPENNLPFMRYGNSDKVKTGEWVLAVGNPFSLNSTVTAGIISAKARNIGIIHNQNQLQIESFLQTDAAVNPGNSGGALVNLKGELIGINTAIATQTGTYSGYSFAVPVSLVQKVMDDLLLYGSVQRGLLGVVIRDVDAALAQMQSLSTVNGVYVSLVNNNSAAEAAGILPGDVIVGINGKKVTNVSELQELVARNRPGDKVEVSFLRGDSQREVEATLRSYEGDSAPVARTEIDHFQGSTFEDLTEEELKQLDLPGGVKVLKAQGLWKKIGVPEGFIITGIDRSRIDNIKDLKQTLDLLSGEKINILGILPGGEKSYFTTLWP